MDNANPTIINASELPTRRGKKKATAHAPASKTALPDLASYFQPPAHTLVYTPDEEDERMFAQFRNAPPPTKEELERQKRETIDMLMSLGITEVEEYLDDDISSDGTLSDLENLVPSRNLDPELPSDAAVQALPAPISGAKGEEREVVEIGERSQKHDPIDELEIFGEHGILKPGDCYSIANQKDLISTISDPEHPLSLGSLAVVNLADIHISPPPGTEDRTELVTILVEITPTITHCSLATVIGLGVRVRLEHALPARYRVDVRIKEGTHSQADQVNKQLADKERVAAALENATLLKVIMTMLATCV
jgi:metal-sulfur cluster biosynthetic enzyme